MSEKMQTSRVEIPDPIPESSGRNPRGYGVGASNGTARRGYSGHKAGHYLLCCPTSSWMIWIKNWNVVGTVFADMQMTAIFMWDHAEPEKEF